MIIIAVAASSKYRHGFGSFASLAMTQGGVIGSATYIEATTSELLEHAMHSAMTQVEEFPGEMVRIIVPDIALVELYEKAITNDLPADLTVAGRERWNEIAKLQANCGPRIRVVHGRDGAMHSDFYSDTAAFASRSDGAATSMPYVASDETKLVVATFRVPIDMDKVDIALAIDLRFRKAEADATVWDSVAEFEADQQTTDWPNEPDDGHEHQFDLEPEDDMGVPNAVMCSRCGVLSVEDDG